MGDVSGNIDSCWILTDAAAGAENPCLGLAEALGAKALVKRIAAPLLGGLIPPQWFPPRRFVPRAGNGGDALEPPWPELLITSGRRSIGYSIAIRRASHGRTFTVYIQNPRISPRHFDLVLAPRHDRLSGANVVETLGSLHRVTRARLDQAARRFAPELASLPRPLIALLIGGATRRHRLGPAEARTIADGIRQAGAGAGLAVTTSRRTGAAVTRVLRESLQGPATAFWDGTGENPYFGYLGLADVIVTTSDSINMISEACATGKPVYVIALEGRGSPRFDRFYRELEAKGSIRRFEGRLEHWTPPALEETAQVARELGRRIAAWRSDHSETPTRP